MPAASKLSKDGWKSASGDLNLYTSWSNSKAYISEVENIPFIANCNYLAIRENVVPSQRRRLSRRLQISFEVKCNLANLLFQIANTFTLDKGRKRIASLHQLSDQ